MKFRLCSEADLKDVIRLLTEEGLPTEDIKEHLGTVFIAEDDSGELVGLGAIEIHGKMGLFRSLVIEKDKRNRKYGALILNFIESFASTNGIEALFLLTDHASSYFRRQGFEEISRDLAPDEVKNTKQFANLCPASAVVMMKYL